MMRPDWQQRVIDEKAELDKRTKKLHSFVSSCEFDDLYREDARLLVKQLTLMMDLSDTLHWRIIRFQPSPRRPTPAR